MLNPWRTILPGSLLLAFLAAASPSTAGPGSWCFTEVTQAAGFTHTHGFGGALGDTRAVSGGVAVGDYNNDGWIDLYAIRGDIGPNLLYRNDGNGTFSEVGAQAGVDIRGRYAGPLFADYDGDGWLDLFVGSIELFPPRLFRNQGDGTFEDVTAASNITSVQNTFSAAMGDYDRDGDLDLCLAHWAITNNGDNHMWRNEGDGSFTAVDSLVGITGYDVEDFSFTPNFADINSDGWPDLLMASDFSTSRFWLNDQDGTFTEMTTPVISDENGMGAAIGDYDNDGDLDWFVTAILDGGSKHDPRKAFTGNRLYNNQGNGTFTEVSIDAKVRLGWWGWAASFQDFNNDTHLDLYHVNGYWPQFTNDPSVMFISDGMGSFDEMGAALGVADTLSARGLSCFDYDRDGDLDIFVAANSQPPVFFRNDGGNDRNYLTVKLQGDAPNSEGIGARVWVWIGGQRYLREMRAGNNYASQDPAEAHFGLGSATTVDSLVVEWPGGTVSTLTQVAANQFLTISESAVTAVEPTSLTGVGLTAGPSPFRASARVTFGLARAGRARITVIDLAGRRVRELVEGHFPAGQNVAVWDGRDDQGRSVVNGVYFLRLESEEGQASRRVIRMD